MLATEKEDAAAGVWRTPASVEPDGQSEGGGIELRRLVALVRRQLKLIATVTLSVTALVVLVTLNLTPIYESSALILVDPRQMNIMDPQSQVSLLPGDPARVESEVGMIRSPSVLLAVIAQLKLASDPEFAPKVGRVEWLLSVIGLADNAPSAEDLLDKTLQKLERARSVERRGVTYLIDVRARSTSPKQAAAIANAIANAHIRLQIASKIAVATGISDALREQANTTGANLSDLEAKLNAFYDRSVATIEDPQRRDELSQLRHQVEQSEEARRSLDSTVASATMALRAGDWQSLIAELESDALRQLNEDRNALLAKIENAEGAGSPASDLREQLAALEASLTREAQTGIQGAREKALAEKSSRSELENTFRQQLINELPAASVAELRQLQQEAQASSTVYENLITREKALSAQENLQFPDSRIVSDAIPERSPTYPRKWLIFALAGLGSLGVGIGLAILRENYIGGFIDEEQAEAVLGIPILASLPLIAGSATSSPATSGPATSAALQDIADEIVVHPLSPYSEAVRRACLGLEAEQTPDSSRRRGVQVILVTSALPEEGKTHTAISLARSFALTGRRVLLIDADLRRPTIHKAMGVVPSLGLADVLSRRLDPNALGEFSIKDKLTDTTIIPGVPVRTGATAVLFQNMQVDGFLEAMASQFDVIVLDSSPLLPVVDARILLRLASTVVMVVRWARTSQRDVRAALNDIARHNADKVPVSAILNRVERTSMGYGHGRYYAPYYLEGSKGG